MQTTIHTHTLRKLGGGTRAGHPPLKSSCSAGYVECARLACLQVVLAGPLQLDARGALEIATHPQDQEPHALHVALGEGDRERRVLEVAFAVRVGAVVERECP